MLRDIWLHSVEAKVYITCQKFGKLSAWGIARHLKIPRTTLYTHIEKMCEKNFLIPEKWQKWTGYRAINAEEIIALLQNQKNTLDEKIHKVEQMKDTINQTIKNSWYIPKVQYYEWNDAITLVYQKINTSKEKYFISDIDTILQSMKRTPKQAAKYFSHKEWFTKEILIDSPRAREYIKYKNLLFKNKKKNYQVKYIKDISIHIQSDTILVDWIYFHIAYWDHIVAIEVNNPIFYKTQKIFFDELWKNL